MSDSLPRLESFASPMSVQAPEPLDALENALLLGSHDGKDSRPAIVHVSTYTCLDAGDPKLWLIMRASMYLSVSGLAGHAACLRRCCRHACSYEFFLSAAWDL